MQHSPFILSLGKQLAGEWWYSPTHADSRGRSGSARGRANKSQQYGSSIDILEGIGRHDQLLSHVGAAFARESKA